METREQSKEELILGAAIEEFIEKGMSGARMQGIAERAGISKTLLHYYFRTKENIYSKILGTVFGIFFAQFEKALSDEASFTDTLRTFISRIHDVLASNPRVPLFMLHELSQGGETVKRVWKENIMKGPNPLPPRLFALLAKEETEGKIRRVDPAQFMLTLIGSCFYFFMAEPVVKDIYGSLYGEGNFDRKKFIEERKEAVFRQLYYGLSTGPEPDVHTAAVPKGPEPVVRP